MTYRRKTARPSKAKKNFFCLDVPVVSHGIVRIRALFSLSLSCLSLVWHHMRVNHRQEPEKSTAFSSYVIIRVSSGKIGRTRVGPSKRNFLLHFSSVRLIIHIITINLRRTCEQIQHIRCMSAVHVLERVWIEALSLPTKNIAHSRLSSSPLGLLTYILDQIVNQ
jgi:hypothetical protein